MKSRPPRAVPLTVWMSKVIAAGLPVRVISTLALPVRDERVRSRSLTRRVAGSGAWVIVMVAVLSPIVASTSSSRTKVAVKLTSAVRVAERIVTGTLTGTGSGGDSPGLADNWL